MRRGGGVPGRAAWGAVWRRAGRSKVEKWGSEVETPCSERAGRGWPSAADGRSGAGRCGGRAKRSRPAQRADGAELARRNGGGEQGRRTNPVVVGDSVSFAEASVAELMRRLERGDVPNKLWGARLIRLHLSYIHARLMTRGDVDASVAEPRRSVHAIAGAKATALIIYVGHMRWAVDEDDHTLSDISPVEHMVAELARLLGELRAAARGRTWLVAAASYQMYMRRQQ